MAGTATPQLLQQLDLTHCEPPGLLRTVADLDTGPSPLPQAHAVRRAWGALGLCGVVYVDRTPTVYLKEVKAINDADARLWHKRLWNHGVAPILVVADPKKVHVYSAWAPPASENEKPEGQNRLVATLDRAADALELQQLIRSIDTGHFYSTHAKAFDREEAVDRRLLHHLEALRRELTTGRGPLRGDDADALLTRTIFACYLIAREVISGSHFPDSRLSSIEKDGGLQALLHGLPALDARDVLFDLFEQLKGIFNGSLFDTDLVEERKRIKSRHMRVLQTFLSGGDPGTGQLALGFWAYDFSIIPIETISAIYEKFIEAGDKNKRRQTGAYYTPPHLVELVVDQAIEGWDSLLDKRVLDVACGSGIFVVSLFNRMAEEWRRKNPNVRNSTRAKALARVLQERLCGVDVNVTACRITCFSLYLALLDQLEPRDIHDLCKSGWRLPLLLKLRDAVPPPGGATIVQGNLFDPDLPIPRASFDLVVGNPPWVSRGQSEDSVFEQWCKGHKELPVPEKQIAHGFMWRAPEYLGPGGRACLVLPTAALVNKTTSDFQHEWFRRFAVEKVIQLCDLRHLIFVGSHHPALVVRFAQTWPILGEARISYEAPKADPQSLRGGPVRVFEQDCWRIRQSEVLLRAAKEEAPLVWKQRLWGTPRDLRFLERLMDMPPLGDWVSSPKARKRKRWIKGQGFQPYNPKERDPKTGKKLKLWDAWWPEDGDWRFLEANAESGLVLLHGDTEPIGNRFRKLRRSPDQRLFEPPMVITNDALTRVAFCDFPVLFRQSLQSIAGSPNDADLLRLLAAVLDSDLAAYFLFHTAASWGTERDEVHLHEILRMPFPLPDQAPNPGRAKEIVAEVSERLRRLQADAGKATIGRHQLVDQAKADLRRLIWEYYDIDQWEGKLIRDTVDILERSSTPPGPSSHVRTLDTPSSGVRRKYAHVLCGVLNGWAEGSGYTVNASVTYSRASGLGVVSLTKDGSSRDYAESEGSAELNEVLGRIAKLLPGTRGGVEIVRGLKVFGKDELHIVKPLMLRFWTQTAALNDADEIASAILHKG